MFGVAFVHLIMHKNHYSSLFAIPIYRAPRPRAGSIGSPDETGTGARWLCASVAVLDGLVPEVFRGTGPPVELPVGPSVCPDAELAQSE